MIFETIVILSPYSQIIKNKGEMTMDELKDYVAADLSSNLVSEIKSLEEKLSEQANKEVVVIAYEKDN
jgi:hypothetical protein